MSIKFENIRELAKSMLFENHVNELRLPLDHDMDAGKNNRTSAKDQPGPMIDGEGNYDKSYEDEVELPITPSDVMPVFHDEKLSANALNDDDYIPNNTSEFIKAANTLVYNHKDQLGNKEIEVAWKTLKKIIEKVK